MLIYGIIFANEVSQHTWQIVALKKDIKSQNLPCFIETKSYKLQLDLGNLKEKQTC
jgi:hypothetical protein